tara:strand:- start:3051 stop:4346 length:1296 start_codon:yes stop_codon:yes gene_type:complete
MIGIERFVAYRMTIFDKSSFTGYILKFAIAAIALSVAVMIISTSVISGFKNEISYKMFDFWGHIVINDARASQEYELIPIENADEIMTDVLSINRIDEFLQPALNENGYITASCNSGVKKVYPFSVLPSLITTKEEEFDGLLLKGIEKEFNNDVLNEYKTQGSVINLNQEDPMRELFISDQTAKRMKLEVGENFILNFILGETTEKKRFSVAGIYKSGLEEFDRRFAFIDHRWISDIIGWDPGQYSHIEVHIEDLDNLEIIDEYIKIERLPSYLISESIKSRSSEIFQWLEYQNINEWLTLTLMTLVGIFNMITAFLIFTLERTRMIGLLKSLGATDWAIRKIFLLSSGFILLRGTIFGVVIGLSICLLQKWTGILKLSEKDYYLSEVPIEINIYVVLFIATASAFITLIFLILPSSIISRISPVSALHFK